MSININYKSPTNLQKWNTLQNGTFAIIEGTQEHPFPKGLYRVFIMRNIDEPPIEPVEPDVVSYILIPMFDGPFEDGMFPYMLPVSNKMPEIINKISQVHIDVELA